MMRAPRATALLLVVTVLVGCSADCTTYLGSTLSVDVFDARTGAPLGVGTTVVVTGATLHDSVTMPPSLGSPSSAYIGTENRVGPGLYTVTVLRPGYVTWTMSNVEVLGMGCHAAAGPFPSVQLQPVA
jgi:hypothetical protein